MFSLSLLGALQNRLGQRRCNPTYVEQNSHYCGRRKPRKQHFTGKPRRETQQQPYHLRAFRRFIFRSMAPTRANRRRSSPASTSSTEGPDGEPPWTGARPRFRVHFTAEGLADVGRRNRLPRWHIPLQLGVHPLRGPICPVWRGTRLRDGHCPHSVCRIQKLQSFPIFAIFAGS